MDREEEPPDDSSSPARFIVGQDEGGQWVVGDRFGLCGGWFVSREEAIRYAKFESEGAAAPVAMANDLVSLDEALARNGRRRGTKPATH